MATNPLLAKPELGKVKPILFNKPAPDHVFGYTPTKDPEGAREVTMLWKEHKTSLAAGEVKPVPDFKTMNKMAVDSGLTSAKDLPAFRASNKVVLKAEPAPTGPSNSPKKVPGLPSNKDLKHTYGMPPGHRSAEVQRTHGPTEPPIKYLVQGAYQEDWVVQNLQKEATVSRGTPYIPPAPTKAVLGHSIGAARYLQPPSTEEPFKMAKFKTVGPKVTAYMGKSSSPSRVGGAEEAH